MEFSDVSYAYRRGRPVVSYLTWAVPSGVTVLLGPNGAGKSTTLSLAASVLRPCTGYVSHGAMETNRKSNLHEWRSRVGWVPQHISPIPGFSVLEQVTYAAWLKGTQSETSRRLAFEALDLTGLADQASQLTSRLSGGQLRRVGIAAALVHGADILLLDEPTAGLDPSQKSRLRKYLIDIRSRHDVLISTHQVDDLELVADSVAVMQRGSIVFSGSTDDFLGYGRTDSIHDAAHNVSRVAEAAYANLTGAEI